MERTAQPETALPRRVVRLRRLRWLLTALAAVALLTGALAKPADAGITIYIYNPASTAGNWYFTQGDHPGWLNNQAHDVGWPYTPTNVVFDATSGVTATVLNVSLNCYAADTFDKYVGLSLSYGGLAYGQVNYVHITNPVVTVGQVITPGTTLGAVQSQTDNCWQGTHVHMERSSNGWWASTFICGLNCQTADQFSNSTPVIAMAQLGTQKPAP